MDIYQMRSELKATGKSLADMPLRVVYYARVSTDSGEQLNSLENQRSYYEDFISANANWELAGSYIDEGLSGITTKNRENFHRMIEDARNGQFDFIITKEISRFARNTLDSIQYTRELLSNGVAVWFQQDSINTIDDDSEMRLAIMSSLAQEESRRLSGRVRFGHEQAIKKGVVMGNSRIYGYEKDKGRLVVNEAEAEMVQLVFELYATGDYSTPKIEKLLAEKGYKNFNGGAISRNVLRKIITNPKYKGYYVGNKVKVVDMFTKKQQFLHESEWEMYRDHDKVPPIVSEELWERANAIFSIRSTEVKERRSSFKTNNLFTGKIICEEHGTPFYMKVRKTRSEDNNPTWVCSHRIKNGKDSCDTFGIKEKELVEILLEVLDGLSSNVDTLTDKYMEFLRKVDNAEEAEAEIKEIEAEISRINISKDKLLDLVIDGKLSNEEFGRRNDAANIELAAKEQEIKKLTSKQKGREKQSVKVQHFRKELMRYFKSGTQELTPGMINALVDKIQVSMSGNVMQLNIGLNTGENAHKFVGSSGYIILTM